MEWDPDSPETGRVDENRVMALEACDDSGNPFINLSLYWGYSRGTRWWTDVIGKKLREGQTMSVTLTSSETERLGVNSTRKEVAVKGWQKMKRREKTKKFRAEAGAASVVKVESSKTLKRKIESDEDDRENKTCRKM